MQSSRTEGAIDKTASYVPRQRLRSPKGRTAMRRAPGWPAEHAPPGSLMTTPLLRADLLRKTLTESAYKYRASLAGAGTNLPDRHCRALEAPGSPASDIASGQSTQPRMGIHANGGLRTKVCFPSSRMNSFQAWPARAQCPGHAELCRRPPQPRPSRPWLRPLDGPTTHSKPVPSIVLTTFCQCQVEVTGLAVRRLRRGRSCRLRHLRRDSL